jgi:hypothetical protein
VYFGASGSYTDGHYTSNLGLSAADVADAYPDSVLTVPGDPRTRGFQAADYRAVRDRSYQGWDGRFGVLYSFYDVLGVSASFKVPSRYEVKEKLFTYGQSRFTSSTFVAPEFASNTSYFVRPPAEMTLGGTVNLGILQGAAEATYVDYTSLQLSAGSASVVNVAALNKRIKDDMRQAINLRAGAEFRMPFTGLSARAGAMYQPSAFRDAPADAAQKYVTFGLGLSSQNALLFDLGYAYGWRGEFKDPRSTEAVDPQPLSTHTVLLTVKVVL